MPFIQDVNPKGGETQFAQGLLDSLIRPKGWVLACGGRPQPAPIPGVPLQKSELAIQSNAIWPQYSSKNLHQSSLPRGEATDRRRNLVPSLPRRLADHSSHRGRLPVEMPPSSEDYRIIGVDHQLQEIPHGTSAGLRMVRSSLRPTSPHSNVSNRETRIDTVHDIEPNNISNLHKERGHAGSRPNKLGGSTSSFTEGTDVYYQVHSEILQKSSLRQTNIITQVNETRSMQMVLTQTDPSTSWQTFPRHIHNDRRITAGLGLPAQQDSVPRPLRQVNELLDKHSGTPHSLVCLTDSPRSGFDHTHPVRQCYGSGSDQERDFNQPNSRSPCATDMEEGRRIPLDSGNITHQRKLQRHSGSAVPESDYLHRVVTTKERFQKDPQIEPPPPGGSLCYKPEQQARNLHFALPGQEGSSLRCIGLPMGQVEPSLPVPSDKPDFEGFGEDAAIILHLRNFNNARNANKTVVYGSARTEYSVHHNTNIPTTDSGGQVSKDGPTFCPSRLEVIKRGYAERLIHCEEETLDLMSQPIASSSLHDYQLKWETFIEYLYRNAITPECLSLSHVLSFLTYLFKDRKLKPRTISCYRSAIAEPLLHGFNINLNTNEVYNLLRAMKLRRPASPPSQPTWSLLKVLNFIENLKDPMSDLWSLRKTAFLLAFSTCYRISELHACVRNRDYCLFLDDMTLQIRPHPSFLAKNECPQKRWSHKEIRPMLKEDGRPSSLCPVTALRDYLNRTSRIKKGKIFRSAKRGKGKKELSKFQLSKEICALILAADPSAKAKVHDIRKFASSYALAKTMATEDLVKEIGWSSSKTFYKYYLVQTDILPMAVPLPFDCPKDIMSPTSQK